jgi:uncharacterized protein (TIGR00369 family)
VNDHLQRRYSSEWGEPRSKTVTWYDPMINAGVASTSIDINVTYLRPVTKDRGLIRGTGRVTKPGRKVAYATIEVTDESGKVLAQATRSCLVMDNRPTA